MRFSLLTVTILLAFTFTACTTPSNDTPDDETAPDSQTGNGDSVTEPGEDELPTGWVEGIPLYPGFEVREIDGDGTTMIATSIGYKPIPGVVEFYDEIDGWERDRTRSASENVEYYELYFTRDDRELLVLIGRNEMGTVLHMEVYYPDQLKKEEDSD